jgi:hypothetical protein
VKEYVEENRFEQVETGKLMSKTGWTNQELGSTLIEYEFAARSKLNAISAIYMRQLACRIWPEPDNLKKFSEM